MAENAITETEKPLQTIAAERRAGAPLRNKGERASSAEPRQDVRVYATYANVSATKIEMIQKRPELVQCAG